MAGEPVFAWCGPQPNSRLLLNYGIVDEQNPNDKMTVTATIPSSDPLFPQKRYLLQQHNMSSQQDFQLQRNQVSLPCCTHALHAKLVCWVTIGVFASAMQLEEGGCMAEG